MRQINNLIKILSLSLFIFILGCKGYSFGVGDQIKPKTGFQWTNTLFLELPQDTGATRYSKSIYIQTKEAKNGNANMYELLKANLHAKGYKVTTDHERAAIFLQAHVKHTGDTSVRALKHSLAKGYGVEVLDIEPENDIAPPEPEKKGYFGLNNFFRSEPHEKKKSAEETYSALVLDIQLLIHQDNDDWRRYQARLVSTGDNKVVSSLVEDTAKEVVKIF